MPLVDSLAELKNSDEVEVESAVKVAVEPAIEAAVEPAVEPGVEASRSRRSVAFSPAQPSSNDAPPSCTHASSSLAAASKDDEQPWSLTQERQARLEQRLEVLLQLMCAPPHLCPVGRTRRPRERRVSALHSLRVGAQARGGTAA